MRFVALAVVLVALVVSCAGMSGPSHRSAKKALEAGKLDVAIPELEAVRDAEPENADVRVDLTEAYFKKARQALDEGNDAEYLAWLAKAHAEVLEAVALEPNSPSPHTWMGIIAAYQSDLEGTYENLRNAARLAPTNPISHTNLAEVYIYMGKLSKARRHLRKARELHAPPVYVEMNEMLAAWRMGDYTEARDLFDTAYGLDPKIVRVWNEAPIAEPIDTFDGFTRFCCSHLACGPYMANACEDMKHEVVQRSVADETRRRELLLEMERRRRLNEIYSERRDIEVRVEEPEPIPE